MRCGNAFVGFLCFNFIMTNDQRCSPGTLKILALQKCYFRVALFHSSHFTPKPDIRSNNFINKKLYNFAQNLCAVRPLGLLTAHKFSANLDNFLLMKIFNQSFVSKIKKFRSEMRLLTQIWREMTSFGALKQQNTAPSALP